MTDKHEDDAWLDLLADEFSQGLDPERQALKQRLLDEGADEYEATEQVATALWLSGLEEVEPMPESVMRSIEASIPDTAGEPNVVPLHGGDTASPAGRGSGGWLAWFAAAAMLMLAVAGWWPTLTESPMPRIVSADREMAQFLASSSDVGRWSWQATEDPLGQNVRGEVFWSEARQRGYMTFAGLPANDPEEGVYQLWIFDKTRDERFPVNGGVFSVDSESGEAVVPIRAKLPVRDAVLFAVTYEQPGGVVVSSREHIVALAQP